MLALLSPVAAIDRCEWHSNRHPPHPRPNPPGAPAVRTTRAAVAYPTPTCSPGRARPRIRQQSCSWRTCAFQHSPRTPDGQEPPDSTAPARPHSRPVTPSTVESPSNPPVVLDPCPSTAGASSRAPAVCHPVPASPKSSPSRPGVTRPPPRAIAGAEPWTAYRALSVSRPCHSSSVIPCAYARRSTREPNAGGGVQKSKWSSARCLSRCFAA